MAELLFLKQANSYVKGRPRYPPSLFEKLASLTPMHERAWDAGTGNGQCAIMVADHYNSVVATDVSESQLALAFQHPNVTYVKTSPTLSIGEVERVVGAKGSVDLVTVATALHYFDLESFYPAVKHVLRKPGGVFAAWTYCMPMISPEIDKCIENVMKLTMPFHSPKSRLAFEQYRTISFPFEPVNQRGKEHPAAKEAVEVETLETELPMAFDDFLSFMKSTSFVQRTLEHGVDLFNEESIQVLLNAWGAPNEVRVAKFPTYLLIGTVSPEVTSCA